LKRKLPRKWVAIVLLGLLLLLAIQIVSLLEELMSFGPITPP
jgi:hypothetical protein